MHKLSCLILFFATIAIHGQHLDSTFQSKKIINKLLADSLTKVKQVKIQSGFDTMRVKSKRKLTQALEKENNSLNVAKTKAKRSTDSSARVHAKNKIQSVTKSMAKEEMIPLGYAKSKLNTKWSATKRQIKNPFKLALEVRSENYATTAQNPMMRNEPIYSRLYIAPTLSVFGLPFKANFFLTTENNNTYKSNFFTFKFDANAMRKQAADQMQKQLDDVKKKDRTRQLDIQKNAFETQRYEQELNKLKTDIPDIDNLENTLKQQAEEKSKAYIEQQKREAEEKLKNASEEEKLKIQQELKHKSDSVINQFKQKVGDSILKAKGKASEKLDSSNLNLDTSGINSYKNKVDTAKLGKYLRMKQKLEDLQSKRQSIEDLRQLDSANLMKKASGVRNPDDLRKMVEELLPKNKFLKNVLAVDRFGVGIVSPQYSEFTLFAASLKGLDIGINKDKVFYDLTIGKTTKQFTGPFTSTKPVYDRNLVIGRFGYGELKGDHLSIEYLYAYDPATDNKTIPLIRNSVLNINGVFNVLKNTKIEGNAAQSTYRESFVARESNFVSSNVKINREMGPMADKAIQIKTTQTVNDNIKIEAQIKQTGASFRTVGNPYLRRNFRELEFKYDHQFFKKKVKFSGFYKEMRDNLIEINLATNRLKGYGLKLSTSFENSPNLSLSYSPYQQGNNHPDSIYRTKNQFSVTNAIITYKKRFKTFSWNGLLSYTRSAMQINDKGTVAYRMISTVHTFQVGMRNTSIISYMSNVTGPFVDSLNSTSIQFNHTYLATKKITIGLLGEQTNYKNGAFKSGVGLQASSTLFRNFTVSILARYDKIHKLWHMDDADVFTGKVVMVWRW